VDVGAHDGYTFSNTYGLATAGWSGVCYEPLPELYEKCKNLHKKMEHNVVVINSCVGDAVGETRLFTSENPTIDMETVERSPWGGVYDKGKFILSAVTTLDLSLEILSIPVGFEVLSIDVEGAEPQVLSGFNIRHWLPRMVIVETHEHNLDSRKSFHVDKINTYFAGKPYVKIQSDGLNTIWIHKSLDTTQPSN